MQHIEIENLAVVVLSAIREAIPNAGKNAEGLAIFCAEIDRRLGKGPY